MELELEPSLCRSMPCSVAALPVVLLDDPVPVLGPAACEAEAEERGGRKAAEDAKNGRPFPPDCVGEASTAEGDPLGNSDDDDMAVVAVDVLADAKDCKVDDVA